MHLYGINLPRIYARRVLDNTEGIPQNIGNPIRNMNYIAFSDIVRQNAPVSNIYLV